MPPPSRYLHSLLRPLRLPLALLALTACDSEPRYTTPHDFFEKLGYGEMCPTDDRLCEHTIQSTPEHIFKVTGLPERRWTVDEGDTVNPQYHYSLELAGLNFYVADLGNGDVVLVAQVLPAR